jgi:hypothetical protein
MSYVIAKISKIYTCIPHASMHLCTYASWHLDPLRVFWALSDSVFSARFWIFICQNLQNLASRPSSCLLGSFGHLSTTPPPPPLPHHHHYHTTTTTTLPLPHYHTTTSPLPHYHTTTTTTPPLPHYHYPTTTPPPLPHNYHTTTTTLFRTALRRRAVHAVCRIAMPAM